MKLFVDTREQNPLEFKVGGEVSEVIRTKLPYGDYFGGWEDRDGKFVDFFPIAFERKGFGDLYGTLTSGMERFKREISRAKEDGFKLIIIVEGCFREVEKGFEHSGVKGETILKTLHTLWVKYDVPYILCNDRRDMMNTIIHMFSAFGRNFKPRHSKLGEEEVALEKRKQVEEVVKLEESRISEEGGEQDYE